MTPFEYNDRLASELASVSAGPYRRTVAPFQTGLAVREVEDPDRDRPTEVSQSRPYPQLWTTDLGG